jgi:hypothetical protein
MPVLVLRNMVPRNWTQPYFPRAKALWTVQGVDCTLEVEDKAVEFFQQILPEVEVIYGLQKQKEEVKVGSTETTQTITEEDKQPEPIKTIEPDYEREVEELIAPATVAPVSIEVNGVAVSRDVYDRIMAAFVEGGSGITLRKLVQAMDSEISAEDKAKYFDKYPNVTKIEMRKFMEEANCNYIFNLTQVVKASDKLLEKLEPEIWSLVYGSVCIT